MRERGSGRVRVLMSNLLTTTKRGKIIMRKKLITLSGNMKTHMTGTLTEGTTDRKPDTDKGK